jgi:hypothetical protein
MLYYASYTMLYLHILTWSFLWLHYVTYDPSISELLVAYELEKELGTSPSVRYMHPVQAAGAKPAGSVSVNAAAPKPSSHEHAAACFFEDQGLSGFHGNETNSLKLTPAGLWVVATAIWASPCTFG